MKDAVASEVLPGWSLSSEYDSFDDPRFADDRAQLEDLLLLAEAEEKLVAESLPRVETLDREIDAGLLERSLRLLALSVEIETLLSNLSTYVNCVASTDGRDLRAREFRSIFGTLSARVGRATSAVDLLLARAGDDFVAAVLADERGASHTFRVGQLRKYRDRLLPLVEEKVLESLAPDGHKAWGDLYDAIVGTTTCPLDSKEGRREIGLSEAAVLLRDADPELRESAYRAQSAAFARHEESLAAILNAIAGWRLAENGLRSSKAPLGFLDVALAQSRISRATLDAMMGTVESAREIGREALRLQARAAGVDRLACWDLLAPAPGGGGRRYDFGTALAMVREAFGEIDPAMGDFVGEMAAKGRIEARVLAAKRPGAFCTRFAKSRESRVFMSYRGALADVSTLAHELGHAWHGRLLAPLPLPETRYPMTLAETASIFAETALADRLDARAADDDSRFALAWSDAQDAATFLLNIPARFDFERSFYELRVERPLGPRALSELTLEAWGRWYGDTLREYDSRFWQSKLHFYKTNVSFYNFPYLFGYLFSLGVYARREELGLAFPEAFRELLRDAGRMEAEELARRHLGVDLERPEFWEASLDLVRSKVERFRRLVEKS